MHELSICQALIAQVEDIAREQQASHVVRIELQIGPLSGVEAPLLEQAWPLVAAGSLAEHALLDLQTMPVRVHCKICDAETEAAVNYLVCGVCGDYHTQIVSGNEMLLKRLELERTMHQERGQLARN